MSLRSTSPYCLHSPSFRFACGGGKEVVDEKSEAKTITQPTATAEGDLSATGSDCRSSSRGRRCATLGGT